MMMRAQIASLNKIQYKSGDELVERWFTLDTLQQLVDSSVGKPITLGFNGITLGTVKSAFIEDDAAYIEFDDDLQTYENNYIVPGFKITSSKSGAFQTVRCMDFALTNRPTDKTLKTLKELNDGGLDDTSGSD